jgi:hypothetical protein
MCKRGCWQGHESSQSFLAQRLPNLGSCLVSVGLPCAHEKRVVGSIRGDPGLVERPEPGSVSAGSALRGFPAPEVVVEHRELVPASSDISGSPRALVCTVCTECAHSKCAQIFFGLLKSVHT